MGSAASTPKSGGGDKGNSIQDDARSFRSKSGAIKMLIRTDESRQAFRSYILSTLTKGEVEYLDYFLAVEAIKKRGSEKPVMHKEFRAIIKEYEVKAGETKHPVVMSIYETTHSWKGVDTLNEADMLQLMNRSQDDVLSILTPNFEKFIESKVYQDFTKQQVARERRRASGGGLITGLSTANSTAVNPVVILSPRERPGPALPVFVPAVLIASKSFVGNEITSIPTSSASLPPGGESQILSNKNELTGANTEAVSPALPSLQ